MKELTTALYIEGLVILAISGILTFSIMNPAIGDAIGRGEDPITVINTYLSFWADLLFLLIAGFALIIKSLIKGATLLSTLDDAVLALSRLDFFGFLGSWAEYQNFLNQVGTYVNALIYNFFQRIANTIEPGRMLRLLNSIYAW